MDTCQSLWEVCKNPHGPASRQKRKTFKVISRAMCGLILPADRWGTLTEQRGEERKEFFSYKSI